jgi:transposase
MMVSMSNRTYDEEFKEEAVRLVVDEGRAIRSVEKSLGITFGVLKSWVARHKQKTDPAIKSKVLQEEKIRQLEKQLAQTTRERDILKKAVAIFSKEQNPYSGS